MSTLHISPALRDEVIAHCRSTYPKEACGILAGLKAAPEPRVVQVYPMTNVEDSPVGYSLDPREQLKLGKLLRERGQTTLAIFHSHTASPAYPSSVDVRHAISPDVSYVLVSLKDQAKPDFRSYRIDGDQVTEEPIKVSDTFGV